jgi:malonyl-CoA O-methyltransferase
MMAKLDDLPILEGYAAWAPLYDDDGNPLTAIEQPVMQSWYGPLEGKRVLDLGCGTGRHTLPLAMAGASVVAVDGSDEMLARARHKLRGFPITWLRHVILDPLPCPDAGFDLIVLALVAEHVADLDLLFQETARLARPDGRCLLSILHPERTALGQKARFIDPTTGERRHIATFHREIDAYLGSAEANGWILEEERSLVVTPEVARSLPRAVPYLNQRLGWAASWRKPVDPRDDSGVELPGPGR